MVKTRPPNLESQSSSSTSVRAFSLSPLFNPNALDLTRSALPHQIRRYLTASFRADVKPLVAGDLA